MSDIPLDAPSQCPGVQSDSAGKSSACEGCPNQSACSSGLAKLPLSEREPETVALIRRRLGRVRHVLLILSGKGGVGKSSLSVCLARGLSRCARTGIRTSILFDNEAPTDQCCNVGLLDLDLCGPSIPCMFGCLNEKVHQSQSGWSPVFVSDRLALMSVGFLLPSLDHAVIWRGPRKNSLIQQFLTDVCWTTPCGEEDDSLDFLLIDTPPGTSDEHLSAVQYLQAAGCVGGAIIITTPQEVALGDVRKEISFCQKLSLPILGIVENMCEFTCPSCGHTAPIFPPSTGGAASLLAAIDGCPSLLGRLPLDPRLARALDEGICPFELAAQNASLETGVSEGNHCDVNNLRPSDPVMVAYAQLIDRLWTRIHRQTTAVGAETGEHGAHVK